MFELIAGVLTVLLLFFLLFTMAYGLRLIRGIDVMQYRMSHDWAPRGYAVLAFMLAEPLCRTPENIARKAIICFQMWKEKEALRSIEKALALLQHDETILRGRLLLLKARLAVRKESNLTETAVREAMGLFRKVSDHHGMAYCHLIMGAYCQWSDPDRADAELEACRKIAEEIGEEYLMAMADLRLAEQLWKMNDIESSERKYAACEKYCRESQDNFSLAVFLISKANNYMTRRHDFKKAEEMLDEFSAILDRLNPSIEVRNKKAQAALIQAGVLGLKGRHDEAYEVLTRLPFSSYENKNFSAGRAYFSSLGVAQRGRGNHQDAERCFLKAIEYTRESDGTLLGTSYLNLSFFTVELGKLDDAFTYAEKAYGILSRAGSYAAGNAVAVMGDCLRMKGDLDGSAGKYLQTLRIYEECSQFALVPPVLEKLSNAYAAMGDVEMSDEYLRRARELSDSITEKGDESAMLGREQKIVL